LSSIRSPHQSQTIAADKVQAIITALAQQSEPIQLGRHKVSIVDPTIGAGSFFLTPETLKDIAKDHQVAFIVKAYQDGSYWSQRDLFFIDGQGTLVTAWSHFSGAETGNQVKPMENVEAQRTFQSIMGSSARVFNIPLR
jgi:hypothetical protein